ncbi:MAG: ParB/RepB/Spo0J family partition protein [Rhodovibrionaceae bacterium]
MTQAKKRGLGRGLASLLGEEESSTQTQSSQASVRADRQVPIEKLHPSRVQPRLRFDSDALDSLADSIRQQGVIQPILVRNHDEKPGEYEIVAGERRWRAAQRARLHEVPVVLRALSDSEALEVAIVENVQRQDLDPVEEAEGYQRLLRDFGHTQEDVARLIGKSRSHVANTLRLLSLPGEVKEMISEGRLSAGHARTLLSSDDPAALAREIVAKGLNVRQAEALAQSGKPRRARSQPAGGAKDPDTLRLEESLSESLGLKVSIEGRGERGKLTIQYSSLEQLDSLLEKLNGES